jgi:hypothetical protein
MYSMIAGGIVTLDNGDQRIHEPSKMLDFGGIGMGIHLTLPRRKQIGALPSQHPPERWNISGPYSSSLG